ncbi:MAG: hypothetical protein ACERKO_11755 [Acetanaerobacterium sp.]
MEKIELILGDRVVTLCELSAAQALCAEGESGMYAYRLCAAGVNEQTARAVAHNAALCAHSLCNENGRLFFCARAAAKGLTLAQLAACAGRYKEAFLSESVRDGCFDEGGLNQGLIMKREVDADGSV